MIWAGKVRNAYPILVGKRERDRAEDLGVDGKIILERIFGKLNGKMWIGFIWLRIS